MLLDRYVSALCGCLVQVLQTAVASGNKQHHSVVSMVMGGEWQATSVARATLKPMFPSPPLPSLPLPPPGVTGLLFPELVLGLSLLQQRCILVTICTHSIAALAKLLPLLDTLNRSGSDALTKDRQELAWPGKPLGEPSSTHTVSSLFSCLTSPPTVETPIVKDDVCVSKEQMDTHNAEGGMWVVLNNQLVVDLHMMTAQVGLNTLLTICPLVT